MPNKNSKPHHLVTQLSVLTTLHPTILGMSVPINCLGPRNEQERAKIEKARRTAGASGENFRKAMAGE
jgi:hypothetical protein